MQQDTQTEEYFIQRYGDERFCIANNYYEHSVLILPDGVLQWSVTSPEGILPDTVQPVIAHADALDILLIGTGSRLQFQPDIIAHLRPHGIIADCMDTGAACRTFNVLLSEGRRVAAALIAV